MILYSIIPAEEVFKENTEVKEASLTQEIDYMGEKVIVSSLSNNSYEVRRLISTNPSAYLNPRFAPGAVIEAKVSNNIENRKKI